MAKNTIDHDRVMPLLASGGWVRSRGVPAEYRKTTGGLSCLVSFERVGEERVVAALEVTAFRVGRRPLVLAERVASAARTAPALARVVLVEVEARVGALAALVDRDVSLGAAIAGLVVPGWQTLAGGKTFDIRLSRTFATAAAWTGQRDGLQPGRAATGATRSAQLHLDIALVVHHDDGAASGPGSGESATDPAARAGLRAVLTAHVAGHEVASAQRRLDPLLDDAAALDTLAAAVRTAIDPAADAFVAHHARLAPTVAVVLQRLTAAGFVWSPGRYHDEWQRADGAKCVVDVYQGGTILRVSASRERATEPGHQPHLSGWRSQHHAEQRTSPMALLTDDAAVDAWLALPGRVLTELDAAISGGSA